MLSIKALTAIPWLLQHITNGKILAFNAKIYNFTQLMTPELIFTHSQ